MDAKPTFENMKILGIITMVEKLLLEEALYHPLAEQDIKKIMHNIRYENGFEYTKEE